MSVKFKNTVVSFGRLSDRIKAVLKQAIINGELNAGDKLPTEEQLADDLSVSKVTVREALREMETEGLIEKRRGIHGGSFVAEPSCAKIAELVINYIQFGGLTPKQLTEFRLLLEPSMVALASERRTDEDLSVLRNCIAAFEQSLAEGVIDHVLGLKFHQQIADACHNPLISAVTAAIMKVFEEIIPAVPMSLEDVRVDLDFCKRLYECILQRRGQEASKLMIAHFDTLNDIIQNSRSSRAGAGQHSQNK